MKKEIFEEKVRENKSPIKAIRLKCLDCSALQESEVKLCPVTDCPLYEFRMGKNPYVKRRELTEEQRKEIGERLNKAKQC